MCFRENPLLSAAIRGCQHRANNRDALPRRTTNIEMPDVVIQHGSTEITVPIEAVKLPEGFAVLSNDDLAERYVDREAVRKDYVPKTEFQRRLSGKVDKDHAHEDDTVIARVLETHGKKEQNVDELKAQWETANLAPLKTKYSALREGLKMAQIREAAAAVFDERFVVPLPGGAPSMVEIALAREFDLDDASATIFAIDNAGKPLLAADPDSHTQYRTAREHIDLLAKNPAWARYLKEEPRNVGGSGKPGQDGKAGGTITAKSQIPSEAKAAWIKQNGLPAYRALPD